MDEAKPPGEPAPAIIPPASKPASLRGIWAKLGLKSLLTIAGMSLIVAVITLIVNLFMLPKSKKLRFEIVSRTPAYAKEFQPTGRVAVTVDGKPLKMPFQVVARLVNSGSVEILKTDVESPPSLTFPGAVVVDASLLSSEPNDLDAKVAWSNHEVVVLPGLLNSGDSITFKAIFDGDPGPASTKGRITSIPRIDLQEWDANSSRNMSEENRHKQSVTLIALTFLLCTIFVIGTLASAMFRRKAGTLEPGLRDNPEATAISVIAVFYGFGTLVTAMAYYMNSWTR